MKKKVKKTKKTVKKVKSKKEVVISFLLDRTGSMASCLEATISGFNEYINTLKLDKKNNYSFSLTIFDTMSIDNIQKNVPINKVITLNKENYVPRAGTPLYDAIGETIGTIKEKNVLFVIMTDGEENSSTSFTREKIFDLIKQKEKEGWTFVYLGANQDAYAVGASFGILKQNSVTFNQTAKGTKKLFRAVATSNVAYACAVNTAGFDNKSYSYFSEEQQKDVENTK